MVAARTAARVHHDMNVISKKQETGEYGGGGGGRGGGEDLPGGGVMAGSQVHVLMGGGGKIVSRPAKMPFEGPEDGSVGPASSSQPSWRMSEFVWNDVQLAARPATTGIGAVSYTHLTLPTILLV